MGNLVPLACMAPFGIAGALVMMRAREVTLVGVALWVAGLVAGWLAVNRFGFYGNAAMKRELQRRLLAKAGRDASSGTFVGFARPSYTGLLDAHEDLGFLFLDAEQLEYIGEVHHVKFTRAQALGARFRPNIHSALGLGRWVGIDASVDGKPIRLLVEPREHPTLLANRRLGAELRAAIDDWCRGK